MSSPCCDRNIGIYPSLRIPVCSPRKTGGGRGSRTIQICPAWGGFPAGWNHSMENPCPSSRNCSGILGWVWAATIGAAWSFLALKTPGIYPSTGDRGFHLIFQKVSFFFFWSWMFFSPNSLCLAPSIQLSFPFGITPRKSRFEALSLPSQGSVCHNLCQGGIFTVPPLSPLPTSWSHLSAVFFFFKPFVGKKNHNFPCIFCHL